MARFIVVYQPRLYESMFNCGDIYRTIESAKERLHRVTLPVRKAQQAWIIPLHSWDPDKGTFSGKARYHVDMRDNSNAPIRNCGDLLNIAQSGVV